MQRFPMVLLALRCAFEVFEVTVEVPDATFSNGFIALRCPASRGVIIL